MFLMHGFSLFYAFFMFWWDSFCCVVCFRISCQLCCVTERGFFIPLIFLLSLLLIMLLLLLFDDFYIFTVFLIYTYFCRSYLPVFPEFLSLWFFVVLFGFLFILADVVLVLQMFLFFGVISFYKFGGFLYVAGFTMFFLGRIFYCFFRVCFFCFLVLLCLLLFRFHPFWCISMGIICLVFLLLWLFNSSLRLLIYLCFLV